MLNKPFGYLTWTLEESYFGLLLGPYKAPVDIIYVFWRKEFLQQAHSCFII